MLKDRMLYYQSPITFTVLSGDKKIGVANLADLPTRRNIAGESLVSPCPPLQLLHRWKTSKDEHQGSSCVATRATFLQHYAEQREEESDSGIHEVLWYPCASANYASKAIRKLISGSVGEQDPSKLYLGAHKNNCFMTLALVMRHLNVSPLEVNRFYHPQKTLIGVIRARVVDTVIPNDLEVEELAFGLACWGNGLDWWGVAYFEIQGFPQRVLLDPVLSLFFFASYPRSKQVFSAVHSHSGMLPGVEQTGRNEANQSRPGPP